MTNQVRKKKNNQKLIKVTLYTMLFKMISIGFSCFFIHKLAHRSVIIKWTPSLTCVCVEVRKKRHISEEWSTAEIEHGGHGVVKSNESSFYIRIWKKKLKLNLGLQADFTRPWKTLQCRNVCFVSNVDMLSNNSVSDLIDHWNCNNLLFFNFYNFPRNVGTKVLHQVD